MDRLIGPEDNIYDLVKAEPKLLDALFSVSPKFQRLKNPALLNTVGRLTTVERAARTAGVYLKELLFELNEAVGRGEEYAKSVKNQAIQGKHTGLEALSVEAEPDWFHKTASFPEFDLRNLSEDPFFQVSERVKDLQNGQGLALIQAFPPLPLATFLKQQGFLTYLAKRPDGTFGLYVYKDQIQ